MEGERWLFALMCDSSRPVLSYLYRSLGNANIVLLTASANPWYRHFLLWLHLLTTPAPWLLSSILLEKPRSLASFVHLAREPPLLVLGTCVCISSSLLVGAHILE